jgi:hypothetical protein
MPQGVSPNLRKERPAIAGLIPATCVGRLSSACLNYYLVLRPRERNNIFDTVPFNCGQ